MTLLLPYKPPYHWPAMLAFLAARAVPATERVADNAYQRTMRASAADALDKRVAGTATVCDEPHEQALRVVLSPSLARAAPDALAQLGHLFDVACDPLAIAEVLGDLALPDPGLRLPGAVDSFEITVRAILGQQVTVAAARTLATRFVARFGEALPPPPVGRDATSGLTHLFPTAASIAGVEVAQLGELGIIRTRGQAIIDIAAALAAGRLQLGKGTGSGAGSGPAMRPPVDDAAVAPVLAALTAIRGVGLWTAHYVAMRGLGWADAFPPGDVVARKALQAATPAAAIALAERWRPWRAYALMHLWRKTGVSVR